MNNVSLIILLFLLSAVIYQDFKARAISWFLIPLLIVVTLLKTITGNGITETLTYTGINLLIVSINFLCITLFFSIKEKRLVNITDHYLGLGDILFFIVICTLFSPVNFILFFLGSILLTTLIYGSISLFKSSRKILVPLAGAMSIALIIALIAEQLVANFSFYQDISLFLG